MPETSKLTLENSINLNSPKEYKLQVNALNLHAFSTWTQFPQGVQ